MIYAALLSPVPVPVPHEAPPEAWAALHRIAHDLEIVGSHERWIDDWRSELDYVRRHWQELAYAPPLADAARLPPHWMARECTCFNSSYQRYLELQRQVCLHRAEQISDALSDAVQLCEVWGLVETAACETQSWASRRRALMQLRERIGPEDYYASRLPACIPLWLLAQ